MTVTTAGQTWPSTFIRTLGATSPLAATVSAVYGLVYPPDDTHGATVFRYDVRTRQLALGPRIQDGQALTVTGGWVWVAAGESAPGQANRLYRLDQASLAERANRALPSAGQPTVLAATPGGPLWLSLGSALFALDPASGDVLARLTVSAEITSLATDPAGRYLYVASNTGGLLVEERDAHSGALIRRTTRSQAIAGGAVAATVGGVWISYRSGMLGQAERLDAATLVRTAPPPGALGSPDTTYDETMGVGVSVSEGVAWVVALHLLTCADPDSASIRASEGGQFAGVIGAGHRLYAGTDTGLDVITPPAACYG